LAIEVLYFADFKDITGKDKENFSLNNSNLLELVNVLFEKYNLIKELIWDNQANKLKTNVSIAINDEIAKNLDHLSIVLSDGDRVAFLLPISGG